MKSEIVDDKVKISFDGEINLYNVADYRKELTSLLDNNPNINNLEFNLKSVPYIDSSGIGFLVQMQRKLKNSNKLMILKNVQKEVMDSFVLSNIHSHFTIQ